MKNTELNSVITTIVIHVVIQYVGLSWIVKKNKHLDFDIEVHCHQYMDNGSWYNTTICSQLNGQKFEDYFKTGQKYRY